MTDLKMPKRIERIELEGEYQGYWIEAWVNVPAFIYQMVTGNFLKNLPEIDNEEGEEKIRIIKAWNLTDGEGKEIEISNEAIRKKVPLPLLRQFIDKYASEAAGLKKSLSGA